MQTTALSAAEHFSIVIVGHVDHGKSTLLGRLYADTGSLPDGKLEKIQAICRQQGKEFEYAFLFDAFLEEQEQGVTIDTARTFFSWQNRQYIMIDAPGHKEFLKNMISGAARAEAALLLIDALEGVQEQSKKHAYLLSLLGVGQVAVIVNKMDLVGYRHDFYAAIEKEYRAYLTRLNVTPERFVPVSARLGDNVASPSEHMPWYAGPTVLETLSLFRKETSKELSPLRFPVQDVYKFDARRIIAGRIASGTLRTGDRLVFSPSNKSAVIKSIEQFKVDPPATEAVAGQSIGITLDEQIFIERGEIASHEAATPAVSTAFRSNLFWLGSRPLVTGRTYLLRLTTREVPCEIVEIHRIIDAAELTLADAQTEVLRNQVAEVTIRTKAPVAYDLYRDCQVTGRFVLVDGYDVSGGGVLTEVILDEQATLREEARRRDLSWITGDVSQEDRATHYGHRAALVLVRGESETAMSLLARSLERRLVSDGRHAYLLESKNLESGLDADLLETNDQELVRRFGEVARLLMDTGLIVISIADAVEMTDFKAVQTLVHPAPVISVYLGERTGDASRDVDLTLSNPEDMETASQNIVEELKRQGVLAQAIGRRQRFQ